MSNEDMRKIADAIGDYIWKEYVKPRLSHMVSFYRAEVVAGAVDGRLTVCRPFDNPIKLPYVGSAAGLVAGDQCTVLVLGGASNAVVIGDGTLSNL